MKKKIKSTDLSWKALDKIVINTELKTHNFAKKVNAFLKKENK
jgi:menaquinone-dependent protoporphyrinogen IX oxidase